MAPGPLPARLPVARVHLHAVVRQPIALPAFSGSTLRGAFGRALKRQLCVTGLEQCAGCPLYRSCDYPAIFATPPPLDGPRIYSNIPSPHLVEPPAPGAMTLKPGDPLDFSVVLIGPALARTRLVLGAWQAALAHGIAKGRGAASLRRVDDAHGDPVWDGATHQFIGAPAALEVPAHDVGPDDLVVRFLTPIQLHRRGKDLRQDTITAADLLLAMVRRASDIMTLQLHQPPQLDWAHLADAASRVEGQFTLEWCGWRRYSTRQHAYMRIGGLLGTCRLRGPLQDFWPFIWLGQWLHVGKKTSFGLGRYHIEESPS